ncbi:hypothetical protein P7C73_g586, partial [Tremellales sp. Uapishka_1]
MRFPLFPFLSLFLFIPSATSQVDLVCDDTSLTTYLVALIDQLYDNGLTLYAQLLAAASEFDAAYDLLDGFYTNSTTQYTLLVPTDAALQAAGLEPPFSSLSQWAMTNLVPFHTLYQESMSYDSLPASPLHLSPSTCLQMTAYMNSTVASDAHQVVVTRQGDNGSIMMEMPNGEASSWSSALDLSGAPLSNLVILPIDTVMMFPGNLSTTLTLPTTSESTNGINTFPAAVDSVLSSAGGLTSLESLTTSGFTIFAPVDSAFDDAVQGILDDSTAATSLIQNHYTTDYSLYSTAWSTSGSFDGLVVDSGNTLNVTYNSSGHFVTLGETTAQIVRYDIPLENGVLHIIDTVLLSPNDTDTDTGSDAAAMSTSSSLLLSTSGSVSPGSAATGESATGSATGASKASSTQTGSAGSTLKSTSTSEGRAQRIVRDGSATILISVCIGILGVVGRSL